MWKNKISFAAAIGLILLCYVDLSMAASLEKIKERGVVEIAVYAKFHPYSAKMSGQPQGVDVEIGRALAEKLGVTAAFRVFLADESVEDDFRNQIWKGHYLGGGVADLMMHAPVDAEFARHNDQVRLLAPYYREEIVVARASRLADARTLDAFLDKKIGVEQLTLSSYFLLSAFGGGLRENTVHFKNITAAAEALQQGKVAAIMGPRGEIEGALGKTLSNYHVGPMPMPGLASTSWDIGVALKADETALAKAVDDAMHELRRDGSIAGIFDRFGLHYQSPSLAENPSTNLPALGRGEILANRSCR